MMKLQTIPRIAEYLADRLEYRLVGVESHRRTYYNDQEDVELVISDKSAVIYEHCYGDVSSVWYNVSAVKYLAGILGYNGC
jgi:hypothetical protein